MDLILGKITQQAMNYAIRSGIAVTSGYAISQCSRLMKTKDGQEKEELETLQRRLESKIRIISPAIDMIELITARGNTSLESAVSLTKSLRWEIQALGVRLASAAAEEELSRKRSSRAKSQAQRDKELKLVMKDMRKLLERIEDAVPLINLAITTSGVNLTTNLPASVSPSRLLQASTFLSAGDANFASSPSSSAQVGPTFTLSVYMLFSGHAYRLQDEEGHRQAIWKEVMHKARVKLIRTSIDSVGHFLAGNTKDDGNLEFGSIDERQGVDGSSTIPAEGHADEFAYQLTLVEDLNDSRVHTYDDKDMQPGPFDDVETAGIREIVPIHEISKLFYADTGKILNIGNNDETNNPVLLLKRDVNAMPPRRMMDNEQYGLDWDEDPDQSALETEKVPAMDEVSEVEAQIERETSVLPSENSDTAWRLPAGLDPEWIALEVYIEDPDSDPESEFAADDTSSPPPQPHQPSRQGSVDPSITAAFSDLHVGPSSPICFDESHDLVPKLHEPLNTSTGNFSAPLISTPGVRTSLSLLEMLIRLTSLQQFQQASHLTITDELLNFFLEESSTTGAAPGDVDARKRIRMNARQRVGFDPYDESPIKRRGEQYQYREIDPHNKAWSSPLRTPATR